MSQKIEIILTAVDKSKAAFSSAIANLKTLGPAADAASAALSNFGIGIPVSVAGAIAAAAAATVGAAKSAADYADNMGKLAQRAGVSVEAMSELSYAANQADVDNDQLAKGLREIAVDAASGGEKLKALGVSLTDASGNAKTADQLFLDVAARFAEMPDGIGKTNAAIDLFGSKVGPQLIPLLNAGADGLRSAAEEAAAFGRVVTEDAAKAAEEFNDNLTKMQEVSKGITAEIGNAVIPTLNRLATEFLDARRAGLSFGEMLNTIWRTSELNAEEQIAKIRQRLGELSSEKSLLAGIFDRPEERVSLERQLVYWESRIKRGEPEAAPEEKTDYSRDSKKKTSRKEAAYTDPMADEAQAYAQAMQQINKAQIDASISGETLTATQKKLVELVNDPAFQNWPEEWQLVTLEAGKYAIAAEQAAAEQKRLNELLGETDSSKIEAARRDMELLTAAYLKGTENGGISEQQYIEATTKRIQSFQGGVGDTFARTGDYAQDFFGGLSRALTDFNGDVGESFKRTVLSMIQHVLQLELEMSMLAAYKGGGGSSGGGLFGMIGNFVGSLFGGGGMDWLGAASGMTYGTNAFSQQSMMLAAQSFDGGGDTGPGARVGGLDGKGGFWAVMHPQETVTDRTKGGQSAAQQAPKVDVVVNNLGTPQNYQRTETRWEDGRLQVTLSAADIYQGGELARAIETTYPMLRRPGT